ncbi:MAG TPA: hypothetical protein EYQ60_09125 [Myxococcales bacterium]|nr:hypothetical protein [Myxococcales bacterium]HIK84445.1 hypothetical protein [Myxococcales bacterium]
MPESLTRLGLAMVVAAPLLACSVDDFPEGNSFDHPPVPTPRGAVETDPQSESLEQPSSIHEADASEPRARGLWVLAEGSVRVLDDPSRIEDLLIRAEKLQATDLFVQAYRGGRAFYESADFVEEKSRPAAQDVDVLGSLLAAAHERGLRVHAWVNVLSLSTRRDAQLIRDLGRDAIMVDRMGRSVLDYPNFDLPEPDRRFYRMGTPGLYLDPAIPAVRRALVTTFRDLLTRYPELDGLHLDYIRHPGVLPFSPGSRFGVGLDFGYGEKSRARYRLETGLPDPIDGAKPGMVRGATQWDDWRRVQVTRLVEEIGRETRAIRPGLLISAAVIPYADRAYLSLAQDWRGWLESGAIDLAMPMVYTLDDRLLRYQLETFAGWPEADRIWPGLGTWLFTDRPGRATSQLDVLQRAGFPGEMFFSDDAISESDGLLEALSGVPVNP